MAEYTARCAARDTRRAIEKVRKAMVNLQLCAPHFGDLDFSMQSTIENLPDLPDEVRCLLEDLDEIYPARVKSQRPSVEA